MIFNCNLSFSQNKEALRFDSYEEALDECTEIANEFGKGNLDNALSKLNTIWTIPATLEEYGKQIKIAFHKAQDEFGEPIGTILIKVSLIEDLLYQAVFAVKYENYAMRLFFTFYKGANEKWLLTNIKWDSDLLDFF